MRLPIARPTRYAVTPKVGMVESVMPKSRIMGSRVAVYDVEYTTTTSVEKERQKTTRALYHVGQSRGSSVLPGSNSTSNDGSEVNVVPWVVKRLISLDIAGLMVAFVAAGVRG